jgi:hypothetical protein
MSSIPNTPLPNPKDVLALSLTELVKGDQDTLRTRKYSLLYGLAHEVWPTASPEWGQAARAIDTLSLVIKPLPMEGTVE